MLAGPQATRMLSDIPKDEIRTALPALAAAFDLTFPDLKGHDALDDALSVARVVQHLLRDGRLQAQDFA